MIFAFRIHSNLGSEFTQKHAQSLGNRIARWYKKNLDQKFGLEKKLEQFSENKVVWKNVEKILNKSKKFDFFIFSILGRWSIVIPVPSAAIALSHTKNIKTKK